MADFLQAFESMIRNEGGYKLHSVEGDRGGMTYAGIARNFHPNWPGWAAIDAGDIPDTELVRQFYRMNFWTPVRGDNINSQEVARNVFDFAVNAGVATSVRLAQIVVGATPDGKIGPKTLTALNAMDLQTNRDELVRGLRQRGLNLAREERAPLARGSALTLWAESAQEEATLSVIDAGEHRLVVINRVREARP